MGISLTKGQKISLTKEAPGISNVTVGLGWDTPETEVSFDLDTSIFCLNVNGKMTNEKDFIFFNNLQNANSSVVHNGDNLTGAGDGDDETIKISLNTVPTEIEKIVVVASIYDAENKRQNFGQVKNAYIRIVNDNGNTEVAKFDLSEDYSTSYSIKMAEFYRHNGEWKFNSLGEGSKKEISGFLADFQ